RRGSIRRAMLAYGKTNRLLQPLVRRTSHDTHFEQPWQSTQENLAQARFTNHEAANKPRHFSSTTEPRDVQSVAQAPAKRLHRIDRFRRTVAQQMRIAMRKHDDVAR